MVLREDFLNFTNRFRFLLGLLVLLFIREFRFSHKVLLTACMKIKTVNKIIVNIS